MENNRNNTGQDHLSSFNAQRSKKGFEQKDDQNDRTTRRSDSGSSTQEQPSASNDQGARADKNDNDDSGSQTGSSHGGGYNYPGNQSGYQGDQDYENGRTYSGRMSGETNSDDAGEETEKLSRDRGNDDSSANGRRGFENGNGGQGETPYEDERDRPGASRGKDS